MRKLTVTLQTKVGVNTPRCTYARHLYCGILYERCAVWA